LKEIIDDIRILAEKIMGDDFAHGYPHVMRVRRYAWLIVEKEGLDVDELVLELAILLHDTGRKIGEPHAYYSALMAKALLQDRISDDRVEKIVNAILYHSYSYARKNRIDRTPGP